jgi:hypothetical protein
MIMEKFMYLFRGGDAGSGNQSPEAMQAHMQKWIVWMKDLGQKGRLAGGEALHASGKNLSGTKKTITDGPYVEAKEMVGGYLIVLAKDINDAVELSKGCPILEADGRVEVRPVQKMDMPS